MSERYTRSGLFWDVYASSSSSSIDHAFVSERVYYFLDRIESLNTVSRVDFYATLRILLRQLQPLLLQSSCFN